jgi:hypothetical protein
MSTRNSVGWMGMVALLAGGFLGGAFTAKAADHPNSEPVWKVLLDARTMAFQLKDDALTMKGFARMNVSWQAHANAINQIHQDVNALERQVAKLEAARNDASPTEQSVIDTIEPYMDGIYVYTEVMIQNLDKHPERLGTAEYLDRLDANVAYVADLARSIADFVDYGTKDPVCD